MLLSAGGDPLITSLQGLSHSQLANESIQEILQEGACTGNSDTDRQLLEASKSGDLEVVKKLCTLQNVNCRDVEGRQSTPLHFATGYNRVAVVEYLLQHGADVHAKDKGFGPPYN
ncbi:tankyrase-2-like, partial [Sinocyclocheilus rhinocerous]|uniref:tankyrase-2-like n=1 Tax=Sinocyclocheilus rhinocerous TaxID=307959 RepID=UPI0007B818FF